jgi:hypothetical protein
MSLQIVSALCAITTALASCHASIAAELLVPGQYPSVQAAIDAAVFGDVVQIAPGTYAGPIDLHGKAITVRGSADPTAVVISGGVWGSPVVRMTSGETSESVLEGLTVTGAYSFHRGGGIMIENASPTIRNCHIVGNIAGVPNQNGNSQGGEGAGVYVKTGSPLITECLIAGNTSQYSGSQGGGVHVSGPSTARFRSCTISGNRITGGGGQFGAGVFVGATVASAMPVFEDCIVSGNDLSAGGDGSSMYLASPVSMARCTVAHNGCSGGCGAITRITSTQVYFRQCTFCGSNTTVTGPFVDLGGNRFSEDCERCAPDLSGDGVVNGADLGMVLTTWGPCAN